MAKVKKATAKTKAEFLAGVSSELQAEIDFLVQSNQENEYEEDRWMGPLDAFRQLAEGIDDRDANDRSEAGYAYPKALRREVNRILVAIGVYEPISDEQAREDVRGGLNVKMRDFPELLGDRQRYRFVGWEPLDALQGQEIAHGVPRLHAAAVKPTTGQ